MPSFVCKFVIPEASWIETIDAVAPEEAAAEFHYRHGMTGYRYRHEVGNGLEYVYFARVHVAGPDGLTETFVSRVYHVGLFRRGGVPVRRPDVPQTLAEIASALGYADAPETLLEEGWLYEETLQEAQTRCWGR